MFPKDTAGEIVVPKDSLSVVIRLSQGDGEYRIRLSIPSVYAGVAVASFKLILCFAEPSGH